MKISILTCCYNNLEGLRESVEEVRSQSFDSEARSGFSFQVEHIIIDGGSTDGTADALRAWEKESGDGNRGTGDGIWEGEGERPTSNVEHPTSKDSGIRPDEGFPNSQPLTPNSNLPSSETQSHYQLRWLSESDQGLYDALNKGLRMATGDVIGILHTDDVWEEGVLKRVCDAFQKGEGRREMGDGGSACGTGKGRSEMGDGGREASLECGSSLPLSGTSGMPDEGIPPAASHSSPEAEASFRTPHELPEGVYGDLLYVDADDITKVKRVWRSGSYDKRKWWNGWMPPHPALFVTRELAQRVGDYRLDLGSAADYEWMLRAAVVYEAKFVYVNDVEGKGVSPNI